MEDKVVDKNKSHDDDHMDFGKLEKELHAAVNADERYWRENDAKFRAIHQKVETYEEFRDIVLAAHLKPLDKGDKMDSIKKFDQPWNIHASKVKEKDDTQPTEINKSDENVPKHGQEFLRDWKRYHKTTKDQYQFLLKIGGLQLEKIFKAEISFGLLGDFIKALCEEFVESDHTHILEILEGLSNTNRFSLSIQFLSSKEKSLCVNLFEKLKNVDTSQESDISERISKLETTYGIKNSK